MPRLRVTLALSVLVLLLSVGATALLSSVQRLGDAVTLDAGSRRVPHVTTLRHVPHRTRRAVAKPVRPAAPSERVVADAPQPLHAPAPHYPIEALRNKRQGLVRLRVRLDAGGRVLGASVQHSSGDPQLDRAALVAVRQWTFTMPPGAHRETMVPIRFHIDAPGR